MAGTKGVTHVTMMLQRYHLRMEQYVCLKEKSLT